MKFKRWTISYEPHARFTGVWAVSFTRRHSGGKYVLCSLEHDLSKIFERRKAALQGWYTDQEYTKAGKNNPYTIGFDEI